MAEQNNISVTSNEKNDNVSGGNQPDNPARGAAGLPDINAENFDDQGDLEGMQLGMAAHGSADSINSEEQDLPSEQEKLNRDTKSGQS